MSKGITPIIAIILLLLITISVVGFAMIFFSRTAETAANQTETELSHQTSIMGENFVIESADNNKVYIRNLGRSELKNLNFYVNSVKVDSSGTVPAGQVAAVTLNDSHLAQMPNDAKLKVTSAGSSKEENIQFYKDEVVGYWKFDEADRDKATDYSGNGNDGTFCCESWNDGTLADANPGNADGNTPPKAAVGKYGSALSFDGADDYVDAGNDMSLDITDTITIEAWIKPDTLGTWKRVLQKCNVAGARNSYCIVLKDGTENIRWEVFNGGTQRYVDSNLTLPVDKWTHIAVTYDGQIMKIYLNGNLDNSIDYGSTMNIGTNTLNLYIGSSVDGPIYFNGSIDEVRIYNRVLSPEEIQEDMDSAYPINRTVASYSFEKTENGKVLDTHNIVRGRYGAAMSFDGTDDFVNITDPGAGSVMDADFITVESWIKPDSIAAIGNTIVNKRFLGGAPRTWELSIDNAGKVSWLASRDGTEWLEAKSTATIAAGNWYHISGTYDGSLGKLYINGTPASVPLNAIGTLAENNNDIRIGKNYNVPQFFSGTIDEVRILNVARPMG